MKKKNWINCSKIFLFYCFHTYFKSHNYPLRMSFDSYISLERNLINKIKNKSTKHHFVIDDYLTTKK